MRRNKRTYQQLQAEIVVTFACVREPWSAACLVRDLVPRNLAASTPRCSSWFGTRGSPPATPDAAPRNTAALSGTNHRATAVAVTIDVAATIMLPLQRYVFGSKKTPPLWSLSHGWRVQTSGRVFKSGYFWIVFTLRLSCAKVVQTPQERHLHTDMRNSPKWTTRQPRQPRQMIVYC